MLLNFLFFQVREGRVEVHEGDWLSLNGTTGEVIRGQQKRKKPAIAGAPLDVQNH